VEELGYRADHCIDHGVIVIEEYQMSEYIMNRLANCKNEFQGSSLRVLCVCSAGLLRSPTAAVVLSQEPWNFNTRAAGLTKEFALIPVDAVLLKWAQLIVCMSGDQRDVLAPIASVPLVNLDIADEYEYRDPALMQLIHDRFYARYTGEGSR
jgi:predicted protein tyrosine phosphatase